MGDPIEVVAAQKWWRLLVPDGASLVVAAQPRGHGAVFRNVTQFKDLQPEVLDALVQGWVHDVYAAAEREVPEKFK